MYIREVRGIPQVYNLKSSTFRLLPYEVKRLDDINVTEDMEKRASLGYITLIEEAKEQPKKATKKEGK